MRITQEPKKVALWNKRHFEEKKKRRVCSVFKMFCTYICWIYKMQHLEVSGAVRHIYTRWFKYDRDWFVCKQAGYNPGHIWTTLYMSFGSLGLRTQRDWQTDLECTWVVKGRIFDSFRPPNRCRYTSDSFLAYRLKMLPANLWLYRSTASRVQIHPV